MENRAHALAAGLFVILLGFAVALAVWWFGGTRTATHDVELVTQRNVTGLNPLAQVRFRGISAGKVISIGLDPQDARNILVRIRVDAALPLTKGTTAQLNYQGMTGLAYVQLEDTGSNLEPLPVNDDKPPRISIRQTFFETLGDRVDDIFVHVGELTGNLNRVLNERNVRNLNKTLENAAIASEGLKEMPQLVASVKAMLSAENMQRLNNILVHLERTAGETAPLTVEMRALVGSMHNVSKRFEDLTAQAGGEFSSTTLPRFNLLLNDMQSNSRQLQRILDGVESAPQSLIFGRPPAHPGPGEAGFSASGK